MSSPGRRSGWRAEMDTAYEPSRIHQLSRHTLDAIDTLDSLASTDPAAADALRTIRLTRSNLEDHWMPALRGIEGSDSMVRWRASHLGALGFRSLSAMRDSLPDHLRPGGVGAVPIPLPPQQREELLGRLAFLERKALNADAEREAGEDPTGAPTTTELRTLGRDLALWVERDDRFADEVIELAGSNMLVGHVLGEARFSSSFASRVARRMAVPNGPAANVDHDRYAASLSATLMSLTADPAACLDLLLDRPTAFALASWSSLDTTMLSDFVVSGLGTAIDANPNRLADGYDVLAFLTSAANGPLDQGFNAGMALGVVTALPAYLDTLSPAVSQRGPGDGVVVNDDTHAISVDLGTYDDLLGLFGAILRHRDARVELGRVTATWATEALRAANSLPVFDLAVTRVAEFTSLVLDAAEAEQAQIVAKAAADEDRASDTGQAVGLGVDLLLGSRGVSLGTRKFASWLTARGIGWASHQEPGDATITGLGGEINRQMIVTAISIGVAGPGFFQTGDDDHTLSDEERTVVENRLTQIEAAPNAGERNAVIDIMTSNIEDSPALIPALQSITDNPSAFALVGR